MILPLLSGSPPLAGSDNKLCPVRALVRYLHFSKSFRGRKRKLFISLNPKLRADISVLSLARWVRETISQAYTRVRMRSPSSRPHEIRAWATSLALSLNVPFLRIMEAAYWRSPTPFINHYLRDVTRRREDNLYSISSLAVAQTTVRT